MNPARFVWLDGDLAPARPEPPPQSDARDEADEALDTMPDADWASA